MSEITYIKTFLTSLDSKPTKYQQDHIFDPKTFPPRVPYTLPKLPHPPHPLPPKKTPVPTPPPGSTSSDLLTIHLKSTRNPVLDITLHDASAAATSIPQLKETVLRSLGDPAGFSLEKVKILYNKKPVPAGKKSVAEVIEGGEGGKEVEFGVMVIGGSSIPSTAAAAASSTSAAALATGGGGGGMDGLEKTTSETVPPAQGPSGPEVLQSEGFWSDLKGFLEQRVKDEQEAAKTFEVFRKAWRADASRLVDG